MRRISQQQNMCFTFVSSLCKFLVFPTADQQMYKHKNTSGGPTDSSGGLIIPMFLSVLAHSLTRWADHLPANMPPIHPPAVQLLMAAWFSERKTWMRPPYLFCTGQLSLWEEKKLPFPPPQNGSHFLYHHKSFFEGWKSGSKPLGCANIFRLGI